MICWLTEYSTSALESACSGAIAYGDFFQNAPGPNPNHTLSEGVVCGVWVEPKPDPVCGYKELHRAVLRLRSYRGIRPAVDRMRDEQEHDPVPLQQTTAPKTDSRDCSMV